VLQSIKPDNVIIVSDGAEDEFIIPIISSRVKIDSVNRVIIRQQKSIEGTLYFITKAIADEKIRKNILVPLAMVLTIWGIFFILDRPGYAVGVTLIALGLYILIKAFHLEEPAGQIGKDIGEALQTGKYVLVTLALVAVGVLTIGFYQGFIIIFADGAPPFPINILIFLEESFIYFVGAILIYVLGKSLDTYLRTGTVARSTLSIIISVLAIWLIYLAVNHILLYFFNQIDDFNFPIVIFYIFLNRRR